MPPRAHSPPPHTLSRVVVQQHRELTFGYTNSLSVTSRADFRSRIRNEGEGAHDAAGTRSPLSLTRPRVRVPQHRAREP
eukprot:6781323-Pyramimonas_sp.AAC.2